MWWAAQRDKDLWGADAEEFRPERWEGDHPSLKSRSGWDYMPFLAGPRVCPARQMVLTEAAYILVKMLQKFSIMENRDPEWGFVEEHRLTMQSRNGVKVALTPV